MITVKEEKYFIKTKFYPFALSLLQGLTKIIFCSNVLLSNKNIKLILDKDIC